MKAYLFFATAMLSTMACTTEKEALTSSSSDFSTPNQLRSNAFLRGKLDVSRFARLEKVGLASTMNVSLYTLDGDMIEQVSSLRPNTEYRLRLVAEGADRVEVRASFGFDLISKEEHNSSNQFSASYLIKTQSDVSEPILVSFLPMRTVGTTLFREQAQNFWLGNKAND